jgi:hypothetical protein
MRVLKAAYRTSGRRIGNPVPHETADRATVAAPTARRLSWPKLSNQQPTASSRQAGARSILFRTKMTIGTVVNPPPTLIGTVVKPRQTPIGTVVKTCKSPNGTVVNPLKTPNGTDPNAHATPRTTPPAFAVTRARRRTIS